MKVLKCPICRTVRIKNRRTKTCSRVCGQAWLKRQRGADFHRKAGQHAGAKSALRTKAKTERRWRERWPGVPVSAARAIYTQGFNSGFRGGSSSGYRRGWAEALGEQAA